MAKSSRLSRAVLSLALTLGAVSAAATTAVSEPRHDRDGEQLSLSAQRLAFTAAERALAAGDSSLYRQLRAGLSDYPLYPYLRRQELQPGAPAATLENVRAFLERYPASPPAERLRRVWITHLAGQQRWPQVLELSAELPAPVDAGDAEIQLDCWRRQALLRTGRAAAALDGIEAVWLGGRSRPDNCDVLFDRWRDRGGLTPTLIWRRFVLALQAGQSGLAGYLARQLPEQRRRAAQFWLRLHSRPEAVLELSDALLSAGRLGGVVHALHRWAGRDSLAAASAWDRLRSRYDFPEDGPVLALQRRLAVFVAARGDPSAQRRLAELPAAAVDDDVRRWRVRDALSRGDWPAVKRWLDDMPKPLGEEPRWRYWRARALSELGEDETAETLYRSLSRERDYHGFLAAERLGLDPELNHRPLSVTPAALAELARRPALARAYEFWRLGRPGPARTEWRYAERGFTADDYRAAAKLAQSWGWHDRAIVAAAGARHWDDLELRFPLPYRQQVLAYAREQQLDPAWVYAVIRQESLFQTDVRSGAGALGLMQLLPATGRLAARALGASRPRPATLLQSEVNIRYGAYYLRRTLDQLQRHPLLATAAYNAGPSRVQEWLPAAAQEADVWAETIPYKETRAYVQRVMEYAVVYSWRLQRPAAILDRTLVAIRP